MKRALFEWFKLSFGRFKDRQRNFGKKIKKTSEKKRTRAQISSTLTWFAAFLIIFFIMILFVSFTSLLAAEKKIIGIGNEIKIKGVNIGNLMSQKMLNEILSPDSSNSLRTLIIGWAVGNTNENDLSSSVDRLMIKLGKGNCYFFYTKDMINNKEIQIKKANIPNLDGSEGIYVFGDNYKLNVKLFLGDCNA